MFRSYLWDAEKGEQVEEPESSDSSVSRERPDVLYIRTRNHFLANKLADCVLVLRAAAPIERPGKMTNGV